MLTPSITGDSVVDIKHKLRGNSKFLRGRISSGERKYAADCLVRHAAHLDCLLQIPPNGVVGTYYPIGGEIDPLHLVDWLRQIGWNIALPCVEKLKAPLVFRAWGADVPLVAGPHNIQQPDVSAELCMPDVLLVPMLAFDKRGRRLGYGGGYYDRTLEKMSKEGHKVVSVGLAFAVQEVEEVPSDQWDHSLDMILTERGVITI